MIKLFCLVAALGLIGVTRTTPDALSAKPTPNTKPATVLFSEDGGYNITSDGQGAYPGQVFTTGSYDFQVNLEGTNRQFNYFFQPTNTACAASGPTGMLLHVARMSIRTLHGVPLGETRANTASFGTSAGFFRFLGQDTLNPPHCSIRVMVHRTLPTEWIVSTDLGSFPEAENPLVTVNTGEIAELLRNGKRNTLEFLGNYPMPFKVTVTCPTCI
jgi:hypothetical protein